MGRRIGSVSDLLAAALCAGLCLGAPAIGRAQSAEDLQHMSIEDLGHVEVTSATKTVQALSDAPASIYVITHDDIVRSGAISIPEILRLAPNLFVARTGAGAWVITARGFSGNNNDQAFSDKLLVLVDGRTVYNPLFSGVYWDMQDVPAANIERIEVISGPGATLWGANAVNGVINIITKSSTDTQGASLEAVSGDFVQSATAQLGGKAGDSLSWRVYARNVIDWSALTASGARDPDRMSKPQEGFRVDWTPGTADSVTVQGDAFRGADIEAPASEETIAGANLLTRWTHYWDGGPSTQVQAYYDREEREQTGGGSFSLNTYDLDLQHSFTLGDRNTIVVGGGARLTRYDIVNAGGLFFLPPSRQLDLSNLFVQDSVSLSKAATLILGLKLEDDPYVGLQALPTARLSWKANDTTLLWAAVSRAVRSPTAFDRDVQEHSGPAVLMGNSNFQPETVIAYEAGARLQPAPRLSFSVSTYFNVYNDLRTVDFTPATFFPIFWANGMKGNTYGLEAWGDYRMAPWWRLSASVNWMHEDLRFKSPADSLLGVAQAGDDPHLQAQLKSSMNLGSRLTLDADLRYVSQLPNPRVPAYTELNGRLGWSLTDHVQLSISGFNLLHKDHLEFVGAEPDTIPRSVFASVRIAY